MGSFKVPFGYKFQPTDKDLICHLQHKAARNPLPSHGFIEECDLYNVEPDELFRGSKRDVRYFFVKLKKKTPGCSRFSRRVGTKATWKGSNKGSSVYNLRGLAVGLKKNFVYMLNDGKNGTRGMNITHGGYIMDEFSLQESMPNIEGYVLYRLKRKPQQKNDIHHQPQGQDYQDDNNISMTFEVVDDHEEASPVADEDQIQDVEGFVEIDQLLASIGEDNSRSPCQLHGDQTLPTSINNADEDQVQEVIDFIEFDELLSNIDEDNNSNSHQLHGDQILPTWVNNADEDQVEGVDKLLSSIYEESVSSSSHQLHGDPNLHALISIADEDQVQGVEDFIEIDELLPSIDEDNSSSPCQLHGHQTLPSLINNANEDQVQEVDDFIEFDESLSNIGEDNNSNSNSHQLQGDQIPPTWVNNADEDQVEGVDKLSSSIYEDNISSTTHQLHGDPSLHASISIADEDQVQGVEDFIEIDELLPSIDEHISCSCQLNGDETLPTLINNEDHEDQVQDFEDFIEIDELFPSTSVNWLV